MTVYFISELFPRLFALKTGPDPPRQHPDLAVELSVISATKQSLTDCTYGLDGDPVYVGDLLQPPLDGDALDTNAQPRVGVEVDHGLLHSLLRRFQLGHRECLEALKAGGGRLQGQLWDGVQPDPAVAVGPEEMEVY